MSNLLVLFSAVSCLIIGILLPSSTAPLLASWYQFRSPAAAPVSASASPFSPSWTSWWHPQSRGKWETHDAKPWNLLYHLGGNGPWIEKLDGVLATEGHGIGPPAGCVVDGVHMMSRHSERYPTLTAGGRHLELLDKINLSELMFNGSLAFLNNWSYITDTPSEHFEQLTRIGPYAGTLQSFTTGIRLRTRYSHLLPRDSLVRLWASDSQRVIDTARYFAAGLFGLDWEADRKARVEVIPETLDQGADTLTPGDTCINYIEDLDQGHDYGLNMLSKFREAYIPSISDRLAKDNPHINFTNVEIYSMQEMCGFETLIRGSSPWCAVFTENDWEHFEYARDLLHYYRAGPGNPYASAMGWLWLNATTELLMQSEDAGNIFFSFVHDGDIAPMLAALGVFDDSIYDPYLPTTHVASDRVWRMAQVLPMGGRIIFERLSCSTDPVGKASSTTKDQYVRVNVNDGILPLLDCNTGPGLSCPLSKFSERTRLRGIEFGEYGSVCGLGERAKKRITFLQQ